MQNVPTTDKYAEPEVDIDSYHRLQDEYHKLKAAYQTLRKEHITLKTGVVKTVANCWRKIDRQYNCKNVSMRESLTRINVGDARTASSSSLLKDLKTQMETMLRQVYLNCEFKKTLNVERIREDDDVKTADITDLGYFQKELDVIQRSSELFNIMLDNVTLESLAENTPDETDSGRIDLSNKTIAQVLSSMKDGLEEQRRSTLPKQLQDLQKLCFQLVSNKGNLIVQWNNHILSCPDYELKQSRRSLRRVRSTFKRKSSTTDGAPIESIFTLPAGVKNEDSIVLGNV